MILSLRLGSRDHMNQEYIDSLIESIVESGKAFDEVWIATPYNFLTLDECRENVEGMKCTAEKFKALGITPSLQISRTIGHAPGLLKRDTIDNSNMNRMTFINGENSPGRLCWNNKNLRKYIFESTRIYAAMKPKVVWIDDDVRLLSGDRALTALCFCDNCIRLFNERHGYSYDRENLRRDFLENNEDIRKKYIAFHTECLSDLACLMAEAVHESAPEAHMALQGGNFGHEFLSKFHETALKNMYDISGNTAGFRAGGGVYDDHDPREILYKALRINYIHSRMPEFVSMRNCEIENLPFVAYGESVEGTCIEAAVYMAYGCNMASVTLMNQSEPLSFHKKSFQKLAKYKPYFEKIIRHNEGTATGGMVIYQSPNGHLFYRGEAYEATWCQSALQEAFGLLRCGIPIHASRKGNVYYLSQKASQCMTKEDVEFLLKHPVMTDAASIQNLINMGFGEAMGIKVIKCDGILESMTEHSVNDGFIARTWSDNYYYCKEEKYILKGENMEVISNYRKSGEVIGCAIAVITTVYGAKWLVRSANIGNGVISFTRRNQILNAMNYIAEKPLPAYVNSPNQILVVPRVNEAGQTVSVTLLNVSISDGEDMEIVIENPVNTEYGTIVDPYAEDKKIALVKKNGKYTVMIDELNPWRVKTILIGI